jgi:hypothetical protein
VQDGIGGPLGARAEGGAGRLLQPGSQANHLEDRPSKLIPGAGAVIRDVVGNQATAF